MSNKQHFIIYDKNIIKGLLILSIPVIFSNILKSVHDLVDMYFVAKIDLPIEVVDAQTAAITVTSSIMMLFQALAIGLMVAGGALMSQYLGAKDSASARRVSGQLFISCTAIGILCNIILYFFAPGIMKLMNAEGLIYDYSVIYLQYRSFELTGLFIFYAYQATRQSTGDTLTPVILNSSSIILNIILTALLINFFGMDIRGAALGTVIGNMIIVVPSILLLIKSNNVEMNLQLEDMKPDFPVLKKLMIIGAPAAFSQGLTSLGFALVNTFSMRFDDYIITGIGAGNRINSLLLYPTMSIGGVVSTFVGQNIGAENIKRAKDSMKSGLILSLTFAVIGLFILIPLRSNIISLLLNEESAALQIGSEYLMYLILNLPCLSIYQIMNNTFQGAGRTDFSLLTSSARLWILRIPFVILYLDVLKTSYLGLAYAMVISNIGICLLCFILYYKVDFKPRTNKLQKRIKALG